MIHFWVRCQRLRKRSLFFSLDWMTLKEPAEFLVLIHFTLCLRVSFKNRAVCCSDSRVLPWRAVRSGHRVVSTMVLVQKAAKICGHWVPATPLGRAARVSRVLCKLPGFALLSQGSPAAPTALLSHTAQAAVQHHWSNPNCPCLSAKS